jgi:hypothetical protein
MYTIETPGPLTRLRPGETPSIGRDQPEIITHAQPGTIDLIEALHHAWRSIGAAYDVHADLPETSCLFEGADLRLPKQAAESIVANMLLSVMEEVGRFSPAYKQPIGLIHIRDRAANRSSWLLSPETRERWRNVLHPLALALERNRGLLLAGDVLGELTKSGPCDESRVLACCLCVPPRVILINRAALGHANIVCETCQQPFHLIDAQEDE